MSSPARPRLSSRWIAAALWLGTVLLFARAIPHEFVSYDDPDYVTANAHVKAGLTGESVRWAVFDRGVSYWHPLTWLSHLADWELFGNNPHGHHATSVFWHALNAALAFAVLRRLTRRTWTSAIAAAVFAWHPLRVESVAWIAERKDVLSGFFWLLALWAYARHAEKDQKPEPKDQRLETRDQRLKTTERKTETASDPEAPRSLVFGLSSLVSSPRSLVSSPWSFVSSPWYWTALAAFACGLASKPSLVALPAVLLVVDFWPLRRFRLENFARLIAEKIPFGLLALAVSVLTIVAQDDVGTLSGALSLEARLANAAVSVVRYVGKFLVPLNLAALYPHPGHWPTEVVAVSVIFFATASWVAWAQRARRPWLLAGWLWFLLALLPMSGVVQVGIQSMADRYTYVPMLGVELALLWTIADAVRTPAVRRVWAYAAVAVLVLYGARTWHQLGVWENSFTLFDHVVAVTEDNYLAHNNRGLAHAAAGRKDEALADFRRSLAINPAYADANTNLGRELNAQGRSADAVALLREAARVRPTALEIRNNLANALADAGDLPGANAEYEFVLAKNPAHADALNNYGATLAMQGRVAEAEQKIRESLRLRPDHAGALSNLGNVCGMLGRRDEAVANYRRSLALSPNESQTLNNLALVLGELGQLEESVRFFERALALAPINPDTHAALAETLAKLGRGEAALAHARTALQQRPGHATAQALVQRLSGGK